MKATKKSRGVALITAMLITALASLVAVNLSWDNALDVRRSMVLLGTDQAVQVALGAESWVSGILRQDLEDNDTDHLGDIWAIQLPGFPIDGGDVTGTIEDLQGRFNINNLIDENGEVETDSLERFQRLLAVLDIDPRFAGIAADWIDSNADASFPDGAEDSIYTGIIPPYRSANRSLTTTSELAALDGMDRLSFNILRPHIAALPGRNHVNVNTATAAVLQSLDDDLSAEDAESLISEREAAGFSDIQTAFESLVSQEVINTLAETTSHFQLKVVVRIDTVRVTLYSLLQRDPNSGTVTPILRSFGTN